MPAMKNSLLALLAASFAFALPAPQATGGVNAPLQLEITCGCWNECTVRQLADPSITGCDTTCDSRFSCEAVEAANPVAADVAAPSTVSTLPTEVKRAVNIRPTKTNTVATVIKRALEVRPTKPPTTPVKRDPSPTGPVTYQPTRCYPWEGREVCNSRLKRSPAPLPPVKPTCDCVWEENCPCGFKRDSGEGETSDLGKRWPPTDVTVKCSTNGSCEASIVVHF